ncbi:MAG: hypothetical protein CME29_08755 [Gemmatimonadetes bacterium]|nr:hypothetical protein [Gemmatimonadota bacterium]MBI71793.1 hypothetical protein [Gemmatimonadota bacterium]MCH2452029.1 hypothetical protein [Gemmatimonadota bacterium]
MIEFIYVLAGILAVIFGFYLGRGTYNQSVEEVEARMGKGKPRRAKRHFMWLNYMRPEDRASKRRRRE